MSEPDSPRWLNEVGDELRREVPVRGAWRARLLDEVARTRRPTASDDFDDRDVNTTSAEPTRTRDRRILISPVAAIAAALVFAAVGAGAAIATTSWRTRTAGDPATRAAVNLPSAPASSGALASSGTGTDRETVRFELAAPNASTVALVGSFNEWNPVATPLTRDPTSGKWMVSLRLPPGRHVYAFVVDGDVTADPSAPRAADDDFGSANSVVLVSGRSS
jgi:Glycogen recognition site of AMP-activated protein kinase